MLYNPPAFRVDDIDVLYEHIDRCGLAVVVTVGPTGPIISHVPLMLERAPKGSIGAYGRLVGHFAKSNPQWRDSDAAMQAVAVFSGPDAYVSPSWYPSKHEHGRAVPTWNYAVVHARGMLEVFHDAERLRDVVGRLTQRHEAGRPRPWAITDAPPRFIDSQLAAIVGFEIEITTLEGKYKLSQNRDAADRDGVIAGLSDADVAGADDIAALMTGRQSGLPES